VGGVAEFFPKGTTPSIEGVLRRNDDLRGQIVPTTGEGGTLEAYGYGHESRAGGMD
jgi:hypothetical protein